MWILLKNKDQRYFILGYNRLGKEVWGTKMDGKGFMIQRFETEDEAKELIEALDMAISTSNECFVI